MAYSKEIYTAAYELIQNRRLRAEKEAENRQKVIFENDPETERISRAIASCGIAAAKAVLQGGDVKEEISKLKVKNLALQEELKNRLLFNGYDANALEPQYTCLKCGDTGYYEEKNKTLVCDCMKKALIRCACDALNKTSPLSLCTFDNFSLSYYNMDVEQDAPSPYEIMTRIYNFCEVYAQNFTPKAKSILMKGATGLGKTHLSLAIANEVIQKGYSVVYVSAPSILSRLEKEHFGNGSGNEEETLAALMDCDLLIIDDLGTEFITNFSVTEIYNIVNSRLLQGKPVIINTNLTLKEIENAYSQRFLSRVVGCSAKLDFAGKDIRTRIKREKSF